MSIYILWYFSLDGSAFFLFLGGKKQNMAGVQKKSENKMLYFGLNLIQNLFQIS